MDYTEPNGLYAVGPEYNFTIWAGPTKPKPRESTPLGILDTRRPKSKTNARVDIKRVSVTTANSSTDNGP